MSFMNGDHSRAYKRLKKKNGWDNSEATAAELRETMIRLAPVPLGMAEELADFYLGNPLGADAVLKSDEILELLGGTWAPEDSLMEIDDWEFLKEQVNAWALEMDMDIVTDVMKFVVSYG